MTKKKIIYIYTLLLLIIIAALITFLLTGFRSPYLPSWNKTSNKTKIIQFVQRVSNPNNKGYVPISKRIAVLDFDGTIACEKPNYSIVLFGLHQYNDILKKHKIKNNLKIGLIAFEGMTQAKYFRISRNFFKSHINKRFNKPLIKLIYKPMIELISFLKDNGFNVYIVTGTNPGFIQSISKKYLHINPDHIIGSRIGLAVKKVNNKLIFIREPFFLSPRNNANGKAENIEIQIGATPILAVGNSNGDIGMLEMTAGNKLPNLELVINHDDAIREYKYNKLAHTINRLAKKNRWLTISMKKDFKTIFNFKK